MYKCQGWENADKLDFPGGPVVKNLPASARDTSPILGPERFRMPQGNWAHVPPLLSPCAAATETHKKWSRCSEKPVHRNQRAEPTHGN